MSADTLAPPPKDGSKTAPDGRKLAAAKAARNLPLHPATTMEKARTLRSIKTMHPGFSVQAHGRRVAEAASLHPEGVTPSECRTLLSIGHPAAIVAALRREGIPVHSEPVTWVDEEGNERETVAYTLSADD